MIELRVCAFNHTSLCMCADVWTLYAYMLCFMNINIYSEINISETNIAEIKHNIEMLVWGLPWWLSGKESTC